MAKKASKKSKRNQKSGPKLWQRGSKILATLVLVTLLVSSQVRTFEAFEAHVANVTAVLRDWCEQGYSIAGDKFYDRNGNGTREQGEEGLAGWIIELEK